MGFDELLDKYGPIVAAAFREAIDQIKSAVVLSRVAESLKRGDVNGAIDAMQIEPEAFAALDLALHEAFNAGGLNLVTELPRAVNADGLRVIYRFGVRNPVAEQILREQSARLVTLIVEDQREAIRLALEAGLARGQNPNRTALDIVGRVSAITGRREGGSIGLTSRQVEFIEKARGNLLSGNIEGMKAYLDLKTRDKRFDRTVSKAIREGSPVDAEMVRKIVHRLHDRNLQLRAETIARTETMMALGSARDEAMRQQVEAGKVDAQDIVKIWRSAGDNRVRHTHRVLNGKSAVMDGYFFSQSGAALRFPGDPRAPISETSGCRCRLQYKIDYIGAVVRRYQAEAA